MSAVATEGEEMGATTGGAETEPDDAAAAAVAAAADVLAAAGCCSSAVPVGSLSTVPTLCVSVSGMRNARGIECVCGPGMAPHWHKWTGDAWKG